MYEQALQSLKEAFPTVDPVVIEAILESHRGQADRCFEPLLRISDPSYKPDLPQRQQSPRSQHSEQSPEQPEQQEEREEQPLSPEEQMRRDEEYARQLALEDERERVRLYQQRGWYPNSSAFIVLSCYVVADRFVLRQCKTQQQTTSSRKRKLAGFHESI